MGNLFSGIKTPAVPKVPTPQESEVKTRKKSAKRAGRIQESDTLLSVQEEKAKLLG